MKITDKYVLKELKKVNICELDEMLDEYPEDERDDRSDVEMLADEASYLLSLYNEGGTCHSEDLEAAKTVLGRTQFGSHRPMRVIMTSTGKTRIEPVYTDRDIEDARAIVGEYRRLQALMRRLNKQGIYGKW